MHQKLYEFADQLKATASLNAFGGSAELVEGGNLTNQLH